MKIFSNERGDTILEVMISVTVLSLVLTTSFALANRSTLANRQAGERGEASKIAQAEMEKLKLYISTSGGGNLPAEGEFFCLSPDASKIIDLGGPTDAPADPNSDPDFTSPAYTKAENTDPNLRCKAGANDLYYKMIQRGNTADKTENTYTSMVRWPAVSGHGVDNVRIVHRIHPDELSFVGKTFATCIINNNVAIALDNSGSMDFDFTSGIKRMDAAKSLLANFFQTSDLRANGNQAALTEFAGAYYGPFLLKSMTPSFAQLTNAINDITVDPTAGKNGGGGTDIRRGLNIAYTELENAQLADPTASRVLVLITDGKQEGTGNVASVPQVLSRAKEIKTDGVVIYAVGIYPPSSPDEALGSLLLGGPSGLGDSGDLAVASPGGFSSASNPTELATILDNISNTLDC
jgi:Mg-chelatase subunit ChlD